MSMEPIHRLWIAVKGALEEMLNGAPHMMQGLLDQGELRIDRMIGRHDLECGEDKRLRVSVELRGEHEKTYDQRRIETLNALTARQDELIRELRKDLMTSGILFAKALELVPGKRLAITDAFFTAGDFAIVPSAHSVKDNAARQTVFWIEPTS